MAIRLRTLSGPQNIKEQDYLNASLEVYKWLEENKIEGNAGVYYKTNPGGLVDYEAHPVHGRYGLYSGSAGIGVYLLRLYEVTGEAKYLEEAASIVEELIANVAGKEFYENKLITARNSDLKITGWHTGIYAGPLGAGVLALLLNKKTPKDKYVSFAKKLADDILSVSERKADGLTLTGDLDIFSDGGFVLYFISVYKESGDKKYLDAARDYAAYIYSKRAKGEKGGEFYFANELSNVGMPKDSIYTGFAHGTAGIGYMLAVLYEVDQKSWQLDGAKEVARFLEVIADEVGTKEHGDSVGKLVPYIYGGVDSEAYIGKYYLGFCHGPAGDVLLYRKLYELTGLEEYRQFAVQLVQGAINAGVPNYYSWGLWNSNCLCCGVPGLIEFFIEAYKFLGDEKYLDYAKKAAAKTIADSTEISDGRTFYGYWDRTNPRDVQSYTGLYTGASGAAANLLRIYAFLKDKDVSPIWEYSYLDS